LEPTPVVVVVVVIVVVVAVKGPRARTPEIVSYAVAVDPVTIRWWSLAEVTSTVEIDRATIRCLALDENSVVKNPVVVDSPSARTTEIVSYAVDGGAR